MCEKYGIDTYHKGYNRKDSKIHDVLWYENTHIVLKSTIEMNM